MNLLASKYLGFMYGTFQIRLIHGLHIRNAAGPIWRLHRLAVWSEWLFCLIEHKSPWGRLERKEPVVGGVIHLHTRDVDCSPRDASVPICVGQFRVSYRKADYSLRAFGKNEKKQSIGTRAAAL